MLAFPWRHRGILRKASVRILSVSAKIRIGHAQYASQNSHRLSQLACPDAFMTRRYAQKYIYIFFCILLLVYFLYENSYIRDCGSIRSNPGRRPPILIEVVAVFLDEGYCLKVGHGIFSIGHSKSTYHIFST